MSGNELKAEFWKRVTSAFQECGAGRYDGYEFEYDDEPFEHVRLSVDGEKKDVVNVEGDSLWGMLKDVVKWIRV